MIRQRFRAADEFPLSIALPEHFSRAEFRVVIEPHRMAVRSAVVNHEEVANLGVRNFALDCKLVVIFAK